MVAAFRAAPNRVSHIRGPLLLTLANLCVFRRLRSFYFVRNDLEMKSYFFSALITFSIFFFGDRILMEEGKAYFINGQNFKVVDRFME